MRKKDILKNIKKHPNIQPNVNQMSYQSIGNSITFFRILYNSDHKWMKIRHINTNADKMFADKINQVLKENILNSSV